MAQPVIPLFEDAVRLLRRAPLSTWASHWTGSVPFALGLMAFWNAVSSPRAAHARILAWSLLMAFLLVWMNCWRATFAGLLRGQLVGNRPRARSFSKLAPLQSFLAATK